MGSRSKCHARLDHDLPSRGGRWLMPRRENQQFFANPLDREKSTPGVLPILLLENRPAKGISPHVGVDFPYAVEEVPDIPLQARVFRGAREKGPHRAFLDNDSRRALLHEEVSDGILSRRCGPKGKLQPFVSHRCLMPQGRSAFNHPTGLWHISCSKLLSSSTSGTSRG